MSVYTGAVVAGVLSVQLVVRLGGRSPLGDALFCFPLCECV